MDLSIILHRNAARMDYHPAASAVLAEGDQIVVFATLEALACLDRVNGGEEACPSPKHGLFGRLQRKKRGG
jgi:peroxiredoxin family protein